MNTATFMVSGDAGNIVRYTFKDGNADKNIAASCVLTQEYYQRLLESSPLFAQRIVKLAPGQTLHESAAAMQPKLEPIEGVVTFQEMVSYCADTWGEKVINKKHAAQVAASHGYEFVAAKEENQD